MIVFIIVSFLCLGVKSIKLKQQNHTVEHAKKFTMRFLSFFKMTRILKYFMPTEISISAFWQLVSFEFSVNYLKPKNMTLFQTAYFIVTLSDS